MAIKGISVGAADTRTTLPITGCFIARNKAGDGITFYIDHFTSCGKKFRAFKYAPVITKGDPENSLFLGLCKAFGVKVEGMTQRKAAVALAAKIAEYGALKCDRVGKRHEWKHIAPVNLDGEMLPWSQPAKEGMVMEALWQKEVVTPEQATFLARTPDSLSNDERAWVLGDRTISEVDGLPPLIKAWREEQKGGAYSPLEDL